MFCRRSANHLAALLVIPVAVLGPASARAADRTDEEIAVTGDYAVVARAVTTADLNLALPDDQRTLRHRLSMAARRVCLEAGGTTAIQDDSLLTCYQSSMHDAWAEVQPRILLASSGSHPVADLRRQSPGRTQEVASSLSR